MKNILGLRKGEVLKKKKILFSNDYRSFGVFEPVFVHDIIVSGTKKNLGLFGAHVFQETCRVTAVNSAFFHYRILQYNGSGGHNGIFLNHSAIHDNGTHPNEYFVFDGAAVHNGIVRNGNVIADDRLVTLVRAVNHGAILDIGMMPNRDRIDIAPHHGIEPHAAKIAHCHFSDYRCVGSDETVVSDLRRYAAYR